MIRNYTLLICLFNVSLFTGNSQDCFSQSLLDPGNHPKFINPLPVPSVIDGRNGGTLTIGISQFEQWLGLVDMSTQQPLNTRVWGYNGSYPGPTILAKKDIPLSVFWLNNLVNNQGLPVPHLLPVDTSVHWALEGQAGYQTLGVPIVTHLHGGHSESASDGLPDAWYTPGFARKGHGFIKGDTQPFYYDNDQQAATIWYHDHALGITRLNVYAGLAGYYLITDSNEINLQNSGALPVAPYDLGLAIQDRMFTSDGQLFYPSTAEEEGAPTTSVLPEFFGDFILVNGMTWPVLEVEPRQYRFRVLNGSDSRFYNLALSSGQQFIQIGTDQGFLNSPVMLQQMMIAPGERKDIILDFSQPNLSGQTIILRNNAKTPFPKGSSVDPQTTGQIMAFRVNRPLDPSHPLTQLPTTLRPPIIPLGTSLPARKLVLFEGEDELGRLKPMLGTVEEGVKEWHDPVTENPMLNDTEIWEIYNSTEDAHPIHLHLVSMQLINRQKFHADLDDDNGKPIDIRLIGQPKIPALYEQGWKDTWVMWPGEVTRVIATFDREGLYVWHCHILSHEDHEMMRPFFVGPAQGDHISGNKLTLTGSLEKDWQVKLFPNPFNSILSLQLNLPSSAMVGINIYNASGNLIKQVYQGSRAAGTHHFKFDGSKLSNGTYYCEVIGNGQRLVKKLVLQK